MKHKRIIFRFLSIAVILFICNNTFAQQEISDQITSAIRNGNAAGLANYFSNTVDLEAGSTDGNFSKKQAEIIIKDFFASNKVSSFSVNHNGSSNDGSKYIIGSYKSTNNKKFRVYVLLKKMDDKLLITQLQFEEE